MPDPSAPLLKRLQSATRALFRETDDAAPATSTDRFGRQFIQFWILVARNFITNRCPVRASALAYTTLLALVPLLAVVMSVSTSLLKKEGEKPIEEFIDRMVGSIAPQLNLEVRTGDVNSAARRHEVVQNIKDYIANVRSGTLGASGTLGLIFVAIMLLSTIEAAFNDIWGATRGRSWSSRVINYWAAITLGPLAFVVAVGLTSGRQLTKTQEFIASLPDVMEFAFRLVTALIPFIVLSAAFTIFYQLIPNTRVHFRAALVGGIVGGSLWQLNNLFNIIYVSKVVTYSKIYGSLSMVPIFLVGLYFSWMILLFGAQVAYTFQNRRTYLQDRQAERIDQAGRETAAVQLVTMVARRFKAGSPGPTPAELSQSLGLPPKLTAKLLTQLSNAGILNEIAGIEPAFAPARPTQNISVGQILQALRHLPKPTHPPLPDLTLAKVQSDVAQIHQRELSIAQGISIDLLLESDPALPTPLPDTLLS